MPRESPPHTPIHLEGTTLEGGGQLLRLALGLSTLTRTPISITNIRGKRSGGGGLKAQHLTAAQWLGQACNARLSGAGLKSRELTFTPSPFPSSSSQGHYYADSPSFLDQHGGEVRIAQNTPGSVNLVLQAILPYILFSGAKEKVRVSISGGTNVSSSPSYEYVDEVLSPVLERIGIPRIEAKLHSRGWSQGSTRVGSVTYTITPLAERLPGFEVKERGKIVRVKAVVVAPRETEQEFRDELGVMVERIGEKIFGGDGSEGGFEVEFDNSHHEKRYYLLLVAVSETGMRLGRDWLYDLAIRPGKSTSSIVSTMVKKVARDLINELGHGGCVDEYMRDQLVVFQALAEGRSEVFGGERESQRVELSLHAQTAMWVAKEIIGVHFDDSGGCNGIGYRPGGNVVEGMEGGMVGEAVEHMKKLAIEG